MSEIVASSTGDTLFDVRSDRALVSSARLKEVGVDVLVDRCAGLDVHKDQVTVCVRRWAAGPQA